MLPNNATSALATGQSHILDWFRRIGSNFITWVRQRFQAAVISYQETVELHNRVKQFQAPRPQARTETPVAGFLVPLDTGNAITLYEGLNELETGEKVLDQITGQEQPEKQRLTLSDDTLYCEQLAGGTAITNEVIELAGSRCLLKILPTHLRTLVTEEN